MQRQDVVFGLALYHIPLFLLQNEIANAEDVIRRGDGDLLGQWAIRGVGPCGFTTVEYETAFAARVTWVEDGIRPAGDEVSDPPLQKVDQE